MFLETLSRSNGISGEFAPARLRITGLPPAAEHERAAGPADPRHHERRRVASLGAASTFVKRGISDREISNREISDSTEGPATTCHRFARTPLLLAAACSFPRGVTLESRLRGDDNAPMGLGRLVGAVGLVLAAAWAAAAVQVGPGVDWCAAANALEPGEELVLQSGEYRGPCTIQRGGTSQAPVVIRAGDPADPPRIVYHGRDNNVLDILAHPCHHPRAQVRPDAVHLRTTDESVKRVHIGTLWRYTPGRGTGDPVRRAGRAAESPAAQVALRAHQRRAALVAPVPRFGRWGRQWVTNVWYARSACSSIARSRVRSVLRSAGWPARSSSAAAIA